MVTLESLHEIMLSIADDVSYLKTSKVDQLIHEKDIQIIEIKMNAIEKAVLSIRRYSQMVASSVIAAAVALMVNTIRDSL